MNALRLILLGFVLTVVGCSGGVVREVGDMPYPAASFGAAVTDGWVFIYSGHTGRAHAHSRDNLIDGFWGVDLGKGGEWKRFEGGPKLQGLALVGHRGKVYRVGGLRALNASGEDEDLHSTESVARFDVKRKKWEKLADLPVGRSSHDAALHGDKLYVFGGWRLAGKDETGKWHRVGYVMDLGEGSDGKWKEIKQPFRRRALSVASNGKRVYVIGGITPADKVSGRVDVYDPRTGEWSRGPDLPALGRLKGFGSAAFGIGDRVYVSGAMNKDVYSLGEGEKVWRKEAVSLEEGRFFHRILSVGGRKLLVLGGASRKGHMKSVEVWDGEDDQATRSE